MRIFQPTVTGSNTTTGSLHISGPVYFYTLETSSVFHVLTYNTSSGQVFYTASDAIGKKPGEPDQSIQFNDGGEFSGSVNFTFNGTDIVYLTGSMLVSGAISASYGSDTVGFYGTASWAQSASNALFAQTASFITASNVWGPFGSSSVASASFASSSISASYAETASLAYTASFITASNVWGPFGSSSVASASFASSSVSASYAETASLAYTASFITASNVWGIFGSSSVDSASFASSSISASYAETASFILNPYPINVTGSSLYSVAPVAGIPNIPEDNNSIFFGYQAGFQTDLASNSNFLGYQVGYSANTASNSNFLGYQAGYLSDFVTQSNFLGYQAGYQVDNAYNSNFLGYRAGRLVKDAYNSNFIGYEAGSQQSSINTSSHNSNFIGYQVGKNTNNVYNSNFIGYNAGTNADFSPYSNFLGYQAGNGSISASYSNFIGYNAGYSSDLSSHSIFIGYEAGSAAPTSSNSTFIGYRAGYTARNSNNSIFIGYEAGREVFNSSHSIFIGYQAGKEFDTGGVDYVGPNNIIIGTNVTLPISSQDSINIGGLIFATGSNSNVVPTTPTATPAGGKVGINIYPPLYNFHVSGTVAFPNLTTSSQINVVIIDTASGQLYYTSSTSVGGGGGGTPAPEDTYIQYNSGSKFGATGSFRFIYNSQSLQQGFNVTASGLYSHAEGDSAIAGWKGFRVAILTNGLITIQDNIDYSSEFTSGTIILFNGTYYSTYTYNAVAYSAPDFTIQLDNTGISFFPAPPVGTSVADTSNLNSSLAYMNNGNYSHAEGQAITYANYSHAEGAGQAYGVLSHAEGSGYAYGQISHAEGLGTAYGNYSHAEGSGAAGTLSHAEGNSTIAGWFGSTVNSIVNGLITINLGIDFSSEFTGNTIVLRDNSLNKSYLYTYNAINYNAPNFTIQLDDTSINKGSGDTVADTSNLFSPLTATRTNYYSHAEGIATTVYGFYSHAGGNNTIALGDSQFVIGAYNEPKNSSSAFIIGDGFNGSNRHNVLFASASYFEVSASNTYLQGLPYLTSSFILTYDSSSGQVYFASSSTVGGGAAGNPAPPTNSIQFNNGGVFGGNSTFLFTPTISPDSSSIPGSSSLVDLLGREIITGSLIITNPTATGIYTTSSWTSSLTLQVIGTSSFTGSTLITGSANVNGTLFFGTGSAQALFTTAKITTVSGINTIYSLQTSSYDGAFFDYTLISGLNARAGQIMSIWSGSDIRYTETTTTDIGSTSEFIFSVALTAGSASLQVTGSTGAVIKTIIKSI